MMLAAHRLLFPLPFFLIVLVGVGSCSKQPGGADEQPSDVEDGDAGDEEPGDPGPGDQGPGDPGPGDQDSGVDTTPPTVLSTIPTENADAVAVDTAVLVTFSEALDPITVTASSFVLAPAPGAVAYAAAAHQVTVTPTGQLPGQQVTLTVSGVRDPAGNALAQPFTLHYTTAAPPAPIYLDVPTVSPASGAVDVARDATIVLTFAVALDPATVTAGNVSIDGIAADVALDATGQIISLTPAALLPNAASITVHVSTGLTDTAGHALSSPFSFSFTTADELPPLVATTEPADGDAGVARTSAVVVTFNEAMEASTITSASVLLDGISALVTYDELENAATLTPLAPLPSLAVVVGRVAPTVTDLAGNALASEYVFSFTTEVGDVTPPTVTGTVPAAGAVNVDKAAAVQITFSEALSEATVTSANFSIDGVTASVSFDGASNTVTLTPSPSLPSDAALTVRAGVGAADTFGNHLASEYAFDFHTKDEGPPHVVSTVPADNDTGVLRTAPVVIHFNEPLRHATVDDVHFTCDGVTTAVVWDGTAYANNATVTPQAGQWPNEATIICRVMAGVTDLDGTPLGADYVFSFNTEDTVPPTITATQPTSGATGVQNDALVTATFDEPMAASTITSASFTVAGQSGTVTYDAPSRTATWTPSAPLASSTSHTAEVAATVTDAHGNPLDAYQWTFTTGADTTPPAVVSSSPGPYAHFVPASALLTVTFSEWVDPASLTGGHITLTGPAGAVSGSVSYVAATHVATLTPSAALSPGVGYTLSVSGVQDFDGNTMTGTYTAPFRTVPNIVQISGVTETLRSNLTLAANGANVMMLFNASGGNGGRLLRWAYNTAGTWSANGELGSGVYPGAPVKYGTGFATQVGSSVAFFNGSSWSTPAGSPSGSGGILAAIGSQLVSVNVANRYAVFNGTSWSALSAPLSTHGRQAFVANGSRGLLVTLNPVPPKYEFYARIYDGAAWGTETLIATLDSTAAYAGTKAVASATGFAVVVSSYDSITWPNGLSLALVYDGSSGSWSTIQVPAQEIELETNGSGYCMAWSQTGASTDLYAQVYKDGAWGTPATSTGWYSPFINGLKSDGTGYLVLGRKTAASLGAWRYDGSAWSTSTPPTTGTLTSPALDSATGVYAVSWLSTGQAFATLFTTSWQPSVQLSAGARVDALTLAAVGSTLMAAYAQGPIATRSSNGSGGFDAALAVTDPPVPTDVTYYQLAVAANGKAVAVWMQWERGEQATFMRAFDGLTWGSILRVARVGRMPSIATDGTNWVITWIESGSPSGWARAARWTEAGGLGGWTDLSTGYRVSGKAPIASTGSDFVTFWTETNDVYSRYSVDGSSFAAPVVMEHMGGLTPFGGASLAASSLGYVASYHAPGAPAQIRARPSGAASSWSSPALLTDAICTVLAGDTVYAAACGTTYDPPTKIYLSTNGTSWGPAKTVSTTNAMVGIAPAAGGRFRTVAGTTVYNSTGTVFDTTTPSVPGLVPPIALASDQKNWFLLGAASAMDNGIRVYDTSGASFQDRGVLETETVVAAPVMSGALGVVGAVWPRYTGSPGVQSLWGSLF